MILYLLTELFSTTSRAYPYTSFVVLLWPLSACFSYNRTEHSQGTPFLIIKKQFAVNNLYLFLLEPKIARTKVQSFLIMCGFCYFLNEVCELYKTILIINAHIITVVVWMN